MDPSTYLSRVLSSSSYSGRSLRSLGDALGDKLGKKLFEHQFLDKHFDLCAIGTNSRVLLCRKESSHPGVLNPARKFWS